MLMRLTDEALKNCRNETAKEVACFNEIIDQRSNALKQLEEANLFHNEINERSEEFAYQTTPYIKSSAGLIVNQICAFPLLLCTVYTFCRFIFAAAFECCIGVGAIDVSV